MSESFAVWLFFPDGSNYQEARWLDAEEAVNLARDCIHRPAALMGWIRRVIITDNWDETNFEWRFGEGIVFPPAPNGEIRK
jgi:hypothetical protein